MNIRRKMHTEPPGHSSALNDILFILLLFFLIISTLANPNVIKMNTPKAKSDTKAKQTVVVSISEQQQFYVGTTAVVVDSLKYAIAQAVAKAQDAEPTVVINADSLGNASSIVAVMRVAHELNLRTVLAVDNNAR